MAKFRLRAIPVQSPEIARMEALARAGDGVAIRHLPRLKAKASGGKVTVAEGQEVRLEAGQEREVILASAPSAALIERWRQAGVGAVQLIERTVTLTSGPSALQCLGRLFRRGVPEVVELTDAEALGLAEQGFSVEPLAVEPVTKAVSPGGKKAAAGAAESNGGEA